MNIWVWPVIALAILIAWVLGGSLEWKPSQKLVYYLERLKYRVTEADCVPVITLNIDAREFCRDDIEKEIYIVRKSRVSDPQKNHINVRIHTEKEIMNTGERDNIIHRLERRFPGINVEFLAEGLDGE